MTGDVAGGRFAVDGAAFTSGGGFGCADLLVFVVRLESTTNSSATAAGASPSGPWARGPGGVTFAALIAGTAIWVRRHRLRRLAGPAAAANRRAGADPGAACAGPAAAAANARRRARRRGAAPAEPRAASDGRRRAAAAPGTGGRSVD